MTLQQLQKKIEKLEFKAYEVENELAILSIQLKKMINEEKKASALKIAPAKKRGRPATKK